MPNTSFVTATCRVNLKRLKSIIIKDSSVHTTPIFNDSHKAAGTWSTVWSCIWPWHNLYFFSGTGVPPSTHSEGPSAPYAWSEQTRPWMTARRTASPSRGTVTAGPRNQGDTKRRSGAGGPQSRDAPGCSLLPHLPRGEDLYSSRGASSGGSHGLNS